MRRGLLLFAVLVTCGALVAVIIAASLIASNARIDKAQTALDALCAQRHDLDQRIVAERGLLIVNPHKKRIFGIPRSLIVDGWHRDMATRQNLEILDCKEAP